MVLKGDPAAQVREGWSAHVRMSCNLQKMRLQGTAWVTQEAAPGQWCDLSQRARDIRHRGPHTTRSWGFPWHLCPSCSPYSVLTHFFPSRIRPALCAVIVALALEQFPLGVQHPGGWSSSLGRGVLGICRRTPVWTDTCF